MTKKGVSHSGVQVLDKAVGLELRVIKFPKVENVSQQVQTHLHKFLLNVVIRMGSNISGKNSGRFWRTELAFVGNPVAKIQISKPRHVSYLTQEVGNFENMSEVVDNLVQEWDQIGKNRDKTYYIFKKFREINCILMSLLPIHEHNGQQ